jgi:hypothetical protein
LQVGVTSDRSGGAKSPFDEVTISAITFRFSRPKKLLYEDQSEPFPYFFQAITIGKISAGSVQYGCRFSDGPQPITTRGESHAEALGVLNENGIRVGKGINFRG